VGGAAGAGERRRAVSPGTEGARGRNASKGVGGRGRGVRPAGFDPGAGGPATMFGSLGAMLRARLYSRQQVGQRHSMTSDPSGFLNRVSRQPNCALMRV